MQLRGALLNLHYHASFMADLLLERGELEEAEAALALTGLGEQLPGSVHSTFFGDVRGKVRLERRRPREALADFTEVGRILEPLEIDNPAFRAWRSHAALALHALGRDPEGCELAAEELELARRWGAARPIGVALCALGLVQGGREGESHLGEAVEILAGSSARLEHAKALIELGAMLRRTNRRAQARDPLQRGLELARKCGAKPLFERAHTELVATGARPRRLVFSGVEALTPSERRVATMAADGMTNRDIAQALFVTPRTVEVHLSSTYRKLGIGSRSQLPHALAARVDARGETEPTPLTIP
jgi:DNA-binding CsgD family transcriptional regulator